MTTAILYSALAVLLLVGLVALLRWSQDAPTAPGDDEQESIQGLWEPASVALAERIFDPADYYWLRDEVGFPRLAESLYETRRRLALAWLRAARRSFEDLLRIPEPPRAFDDRPASRSGWQLLGQVLRFQMILSYASFVVRYFGPYHSLVPSFRWIAPEPDIRLNGDAITTSHLGHRR